jgi:DNA-binding HxlR family transcriptional regulator
MAEHARLRGPACALLRICRHEGVSEIVFGVRESKSRPRDLRHLRKLASTTLYSHVAELIALGIVVKRESAGPPRGVFYELGPNGVEFDEVLRGWADLLARLPAANWDTPLHCAEAWAAGIVQALLEGPLTTAQVIAACAGRASEAQVERLLHQLGADGVLIHTDHSFELGDVARLAVAELAEAARFERAFMPDAVPITVEDVGGALRADLPLLELPGDIHGICEFAVLAGRGKAMAMAWAEIQGGRVVASGGGKPPRPATSWAQATIGVWIAAVMDRRPGLVRTAGERRLGQAVLNALCSRLYRKR